MIDVGRAITSFPIAHKIAVDGFMGPKKIRHGKASLVLQSMDTTMFLVGGLCFVIVGLINEITPTMPFVHQMLLSAVCITFIEFVSGCVLNLYLGLNIWDYTDEFANVLGQICLKHTIYWFLLSAVAILLDDRIRYELFGEEIPHYKLFVK